MKRGNVFGMRFDNNANKYNYSFPTKISLRKHIFNLNKLRNNNNEIDKDLITKTDYNYSLLKSSKINRNYLVLFPPVQKAQ